MRKAAKKLDPEKHEEGRKPTSQSSSDGDFTSDTDSSNSDSDLTPTPSPKVSRAFTEINEQTKDLLSMLRQSVDLEEWQLKEDNKFDNKTQAIHIEKLFTREKDEDVDEEELAPNLQEKKDEIRLAQLEETRPKWFTISLKVAFHVCVFVNFFMSWYDSFRLLMENAKMNQWLLQDDYNCLEIVPNVDWLDHTMNIMHALLSCAVLYVHKRSSATLCLAWICSQGAHSIFKTFQFFYNLKFEKDAFSNKNWEGIFTLIGVTALDVFCALILLHKYYDLTDRFRTRAKYFGTTDTSERSLNDRIIYNNNTRFLQRKSILRDVTTQQTYAIIRKIGKHMKQGLHVDPMSLEREIHAAQLALSDCATAENHNMAYMLRKAYAHRLKELENQQHTEQRGEMMMVHSDLL